MAKIGFSPCINEVDYPGGKSFPEVAPSYISLANAKREGKRSRRALTPPAWAENTDVSRDTYVYLFSIGFRILNDMHEAHVLEDKPTVEQMTEVLLAHALTFTDTLMDSPDYSRKAKRLRESDPARLASNAAEKVVREWDWNYIGKRVRAGRVTAEKRVYVKTFTLEDLESVQHIKSKRGQAEALGCGTATIARLRREWAEREVQIMKQREDEALAREVDEMLAEFLAETTPEPLGIVEQELVRLRAERESEFRAMDHSAWLDQVLAA